MISQQNVIDGFRSEFASEPTAIAFAPGRVNLIGEHIDYCDGLVLPMALERGIAIAFAPNQSTNARYRSVEFQDQPFEISLLQAPQRGAPQWSKYVRGVMAEFANRYNCSAAGFDALVCSDLPTAAGLSSSAALELAVATMLEFILDLSLDAKEKARLCQRAEHEFAGVPCGLMDQLASSLGRKDHLIQIDCRSESVELIPFRSPDLTFIVANTNVSRHLGDEAYALRRQQTEQALRDVGETSWRDVTQAELSEASGRLDPILTKRAAHVVSETHRTRFAIEAVRRSDFAVFGQLMNESHRSLRDDFEVSCRELDTMVEIAQQIGAGGNVLGSRMTGAGFGGSTVTLVRADYADTIVEQLASQYRAHTGIIPEIFCSRPADGARLIRLPRAAG